MTEHRVSLNSLYQALKDGGHSIFSPSGSGLWLNCSGGLIANLLAKDDAGVDAAEGTVAHGVGELWLRSHQRPSHLVGTIETVRNGDTDFEIEITETMLDFCETYFDWCKWLPGQHFVETKVYFSQITPIDRQGGTADHVACVWQHMTITDFKYGKGNPVHAEGNTQGLLYALGFFYEYDWLYDFQTITIRICQPRLGIMEDWAITRAELLEWAEYAKVRAHLAWDLDAPRTAGVKQCTFCKVKTDCTAYVQMQEDIVSAVFSDIGKEMTVERSQDLKERLDIGIVKKHLDVHTLTVDQMATIYAYRGTAERWWKALHNELTRRAIAGIMVPGMKLVEGRTHRAIANIPQAVSALAEHGIMREELIEETIASPLKIETILSKHGIRSRKTRETILTPLVRKPPGKATLVKDADPRPAIVDLGEIAFADLVDENLTSETEDL